MRTGLPPPSLIVGITALLLSVQLSQVQSQSAPCTTPTRNPGLCVDIRRCTNIFNIVSNPTPPPTGIANYIKKAACTLPGIERSVCCQPHEVKPEQPTTAAPPTSVGGSSLLPDKCGQAVADRIAFGNVTKVFDYPWMAVLKYNSNGELVDGCGGSLINKRYILTAAHCLRTRSTLQLQVVRLGEHDKSSEIDCNIYKNKKGEIIERDCANKTEDYGIESIVVHESYQKPKYSNDIGLIRLDRDVEMQDHIHPICLPVTPALRSAQFERYVVTGWGTTEKQTGSDVLLSAIVPRVSNAECQERMAQNNLKVQLSDKQMCAGGEGLVDTCRGDSGGPLGYSADFNGARFVQFGVVSAGIDSCGLKSVPGIYCRVAAYMDWILANMKP
ncbi:serine protease grass-like [Uranotaenia lowii]|uniref:serine protease grass-like n=1 Tax=Uranotaenia lowii TaxID=190385 RepID=UPI002478D41C|nr:serine protease grass-like [Uranotaenia lowii]